MQRANQFYNSFDKDPFGKPEENLYHRTEFQRDRDRVLRSSAFRRLQGKTQVFMSGEYDFYRTRLTHSLEVAQIGKSICHHLIYGDRTDKLLTENYYIDPDLVEAICLAHDIGHPPFGHAGERALNDCMGEYGGFEGNAQTLRLLTELIYSNGMAPTRALIDGVMKYKTLRGMYRIDRADNEKIPNNHFLYDQQRRYVEFIFNGSVPTVPDGLKTIEDEKFRSIECQIMNWADDIANALADIEDGVKARFLTASKVGKWIEKNQSLVTSNDSVIHKLKTAIEKSEIKVFIGNSMNDWISATDIMENPSPAVTNTNRHRYKLSIEEPVHSVDLCKKMVRDLVFETPSVHQLDHKSKLVVSRLFKEFCQEYIKENPDPKTIKAILALLPADVAESLGGPETIRGICDYIAGMSDGFAVRVYKRLFDPEYGSIADIV